jgi:flagellar biosynthesis/type III secretory pathway protein FliH
VLREAVNNGYAEGVRAGEADRQDGYRSAYQSSYAYEDANYGYTGMYVDQGDYNYYFRQGFQRGYQDGYNARSQYGQNSNGTLGILGSVLSAILNLQALR